MFQIIMSIHFNLHEQQDGWESPHEDRYSKLSITEKHVTLTFNFLVLPPGTSFLSLLLKKIELGSNTLMTQVHSPAQKLLHVLYK